MSRNEYFKFIKQTVDLHKNMITKFTNQELIEKIAPIKDEKNSAFGFPVITFSDFKNASKFYDGCGRGFVDFDFDMIKTIYNIVYLRNISKIVDENDLKIDLKSNELLNISFKKENKKILRIYGILGTYQLIVQPPIYTIEYYELIGYFDPEKQIVFPY